jgi:hypothetical protein
MEAGLFAQNLESGSIVVTVLAGIMNDGYESIV